MDTLQFKIFDTEKCEELKISVFPLNVKLINRVEHMGNIKDNGTSELVEITARALSRNREKIEFTADKVEEIFSPDQLADVFTQLCNWMRDIKKK